MYKLLILSYYFPPEGGPAVQRIAKFVKYLSRQGYDIHVITSIHFNKVIDQSLLDDIPSKVKIYRVFDLGEFFAKKLKKMYLGRRFVDKHQLWNKWVEIKAKTIIKKNKIDLIFSTSPPHSTNLVASRISRLHKIPWVADFRDEWTNDPNFVNRKNSDHLTKLEKETLKYCSALTTVTNKAKENFSKIIGPKKKAYCIHNGYDIEDYMDIDQDFIPKNSKLKIVYSGRLTKKSSPAYFFEVLNQLDSNSKLTNIDFEILVVGKEGNKEWIKKYPNLLEYIKFIPYQPHNELIKLLSTADALLLFATNTKNSEVFTGKLFEYLYMRKPIIAIIRFEGELSEMLKDYGNTFIGIESVENSVENAISGLFETWKTGKLRKEINESFVTKFDRKGLTKNLSNVFESCLKN